MTTEDKNRNHENEHKEHFEETKASSKAHSSGVYKKHEPQTCEHTQKSDKHHKHKEKKKQAKREIDEETYKTLEVKAQELDQLKDALLRQAADFENAKKRLAREKDAFIKFAYEKIITHFLSVLDDFDRALAHADEATTVNGLLSGVSLIRKKIFDILKDYGLQRIEAVGKPFDPHFHEAIGTVESSDYPADTVVEEIQCGYMLKDKLLRPVWVRIAAAKHDETASPHEESPLDKDQHIEKDVPSENEETKDENKNSNTIQ